MILFRRVGEAFAEITKREWALLTLETLGVIGGILIAFELSEWAERRREAARHDRLMVRLFEESRMDVAVLRSMRELLASQVEVEKRFATALSQGRCPREKDWVAVSTLAMMPAMSVPSSVYGELIGAGGLSGVESKPVRVELANFHYQLGWVQKQIDYFRSNRVDAIAESDPRMTVKVDFGKEEAESQDYDRDALCADRAFRNRVASATRNHDVFASYFTDMTDYAIAMCAVLGKSIGKACIPEKAIGGPLKGKDAAVAEKALADWKGEF